MSEDQVRFWRGFAMALRAAGETHSEDVALAGDSRFTDCGQHISGMLQALLIIAEVMGGVSGEEAAALARVVRPAPGSQSKAVDTAPVSEVAKTQRP